MKKAVAIALSVVLVISASLINPNIALAAVQTPITRNQVEQRALSMINLNWTYQSSTNSVIDPTYSADVTLPSQLSGITSGQMTGIPYAWGGIDTLDSNSYNEPWTNFLDAVNQGAYTGNVNSHAGLGHVSGTAGVDCSGFVQAAFGIKDYKQSTSTLLSNYFTQISLSDLKHMDILDYPGVHVVIFDCWGTLNGRDGAYTYEATPDQTYGGIQGTKRYFITMTQINSGYIPARYNYISEDTVTSSSTTPATTTTSTTTTTTTTPTTTTPTTTTPTTTTPTTTTTTATTPTTTTPITTTTTTTTPTTTTPTTTTSTTTTSTTTTPTTTTIPTTTTTSSTITTPTTVSTIPHPVNTGIFAKISDSVYLVNMHSSASGSSTILCAATGGSIIYVSNYYLGWYQVKYNNTIGWIWGAYISSIPSGQYVTAKNVSLLNIRSNPTSYAQIIGTIQQNQYAQVLGYSSDKQWMDIKLGSIQGWAYTTYLSYIY